MKNVTRLKNIVDEFKWYDGDLRTEQYFSHLKGWSVCGCMEHVKYPHFKGAWIKPPSTCAKFPSLAQIKKYKATLNRMVSHKLAVKYDQLALYIPKSLPTMQRYLVLCQWRAMWHRPGYVYLFNHYVENNVDPFYAMFILQAKWASWSRRDRINMPCPSLCHAVGDTSLLTRWKKAWLCSELVNVESSTNGAGVKYLEIGSDIYSIDRVFIDKYSKPIPKVEDIFKHSKGDTTSVVFMGRRMRVEITDIQCDGHLNPYRATVVCRRVSDSRMYYIPLQNFA